MKKEIWKDVVGFVGLYQVSNFGHVKRICLGKERILKPCLRGAYYAVCLCKNNYKQRKHIHRLVAEAFIKNPENKPQVNHIDGNKLNNNLDNLEWVTISENVIHSYKQLNRIPPRNAPVVCVETGKKYEKMLLASQETGASVSGICNVLSGISFTAGGYHWIRG